MIDNFSQIIELLTFESEDDYYYLQILQRKKENPDIGSNTIVIKNYYVSSQEYLKEKSEEMRKLCSFFNARAMIRLNKRSYRQSAFKSLEKITNQIMNRDYKSVKNYYSRVSGQFHKGNNKTWIVDVDYLSKDNSLSDISNHINSCRPEGGKIICTIDSKNGYHIIVKPFDLSNFKNNFDLDLHKDNPTNLFIP